MTISIDDLLVDLLDTHHRYSNCQANEQLVLKMLADALCPQRAWSRHFQIVKSNLAENQYLAAYENSTPSTQNSRWKQTTTFLI